MVVMGMGMVPEVKVRTSESILMSKYVAESIN